MAISLLHRKDSVILTAIEIIDELGIQGLSTREIAKRQGISEGTLFRHFKNKSDIILAVLDYFAKYDNDIFQSVKLKGLKPKEAIVFVIDAYVTYYENYPAITAMTQIYGVLSCEPDFAARIKAILDMRKSGLKALVEEGQKKDELLPNIDSEHLVYVLMGTFDEICLNWRLNGFGFPLRDKTLAAIKVVLAAFGRAI